jgi:TetR/AcrR family transcriptional repressor of nem operon
LEALSHPGSFGKAIAHFFANLVEQITAGSGRLGCLTGNTVVEVATHDHEIAALVRRNLDRVESAFRGALTQAKSRAELSEHTDIAAAARFFVAAIQGLRLIGKTTSDKKVLEGIAQQIVGALKYDR